MDSTPKDIGNLGVGIEDRRTEGQRIVERRGIGTVQQVEHVFGGLF